MFRIITSLVKLNKFTNLTNLTNPINLTNLTNHGFVRRLAINPNVAETSAKPIEPIVGKIFGGSHGSHGSHRSQGSENAYNFKKNWGSYLILGTAASFYTWCLCFNGFDHLNSYFYPPNLYNNRIYTSSYQTLSKQDINDATNYIGLHINNKTQSRYLVIVEGVNGNKKTSSMINHVTGGNSIVELKRTLIKKDINNGKISIEKSIIDVCKFNDKVNDTLDDLINSLNNSVNRTHMPSQWPNGYVPTIILSITDESKETDSVDEKKETYLEYVHLKEVAQKLIDSNTVNVIIRINNNHNISQHFEKAGASFQYNYLYTESNEDK